MVRITPAISGSGTGFPHARGDGPSNVLPVLADVGFSPRPWGWSGGDRPRLGPLHVFPTPVGMVRVSCPGTSWAGRFPHARGDGPNPATIDAQRALFSPRPWGWSGDSLAYVRSFAVFPTPVGMVRVPSVPSPRSVRFPHARGDGPATGSRPASRPAFSPRPWGWSGPGAQVDRVQVVFPTPVGMVRHRVQAQRHAQGFPHARGDGPSALAKAGTPPWFSPRPWGWSAVGVGSPTHPQVFPTPVGMVRLELPTYPAD